MMAAATGNDLRPTVDSWKDTTCSWYDADERNIVTAVLFNTGLYCISAVVNNLCYYFTSNGFVAVALKYTV